MTGQVGYEDEMETLPHRPESFSTQVPISSITEFLVSAAQLDFARVRYYVEQQGVHPDMTVGDRPTAICYAAIKGNQCLMAYLLEKGASVHTEDGIGMTPLHYAAMGGNVICVSLLMAHGACLNKETHQGKTPLAISISHPNAHECSNLLVCYGASLSAGPPGSGMFH